LIAGQKRGVANDDESKVTQEFAHWAIIPRT